MAEINARFATAWVASVGTIVICVLGISALLVCLSFASVAPIGVSPESKGFLFFSA